MKEIYKNLFVGNKTDFDNCGVIDLEIKKEFALCLCAKTYHKHILGYTGNLDKGHEDYLIYHNPEQNIVAANIIDVDDPKFFKKEIIEKLVCFCADNIKRGNKVLIACDLGESRSATIGMMVLYEINPMIFHDCTTFEELEFVYKEIYPKYNPKQGIREVARNYFLGKYKIN